VRSQNSEFRSRKSEVRRERAPSLLNS